MLLEYYFTPSLHRGPWPASSCFWCQSSRVWLGHLLRWYIRWRAESDMRCWSSRCLISCSQRRSQDFNHFLAKNYQRRPFSFNWINKIQCKHLINLSLFEFPCLLAHLKMVLNVLVGHTPCVVRFGAPPPYSNRLPIPHTFSCSEYAYAYQF